MRCLTLATPLLPRCSKGWKAAFPWLLRCVGTTHLFLLALCRRHSIVATCEKLSSASRSRMRSETRIHSELPLCFGSLLVANLILYSLDAGQSLNLDTINRTHILVWIKHSRRYTKLSSPRNHWYVTMANVSFWHFSCSRIIPSRISLWIIANYLPWIIATEYLFFQITKHTSTDTFLTINSLTT
jgi:hypothetical protein